MNYRGAQVYLVAAGTGSLRITQNNVTTLIPITGATTAHLIATTDNTAARHLDVALGRGMTAFSFTYG